MRERGERIRAGARADVLKPDKNSISSGKLYGGTNEEKLALFCIGGTQAAQVGVKMFKPVFEKNEKGYEAIVVLQYLDTFGVSEDDYTKELGLGSSANILEYNYRGGVLAQWLLQHQYGYKPFNDYLTYTIKMKKKWVK